MGDKDTVAATCEGLATRSPKFVDVTLPASAKLTKEQWETILDAIERSPVLERVNLSGLVNAKMSGTLGARLAKATHLKQLVLDDCDLRDAAFHDILEPFAKNGTVDAKTGKGRLSGLSVARNGLTLKAVKDLQLTLGASSTLTQLDLSYNKLDLASAEALGAWLASNPALMQLSLAGNTKMNKKDGLVKLFDGIGKCRTLQVLDLSALNIDGKSAPALAAMISAGSLTRLVLCGNDLSKKGAPEVMAAIGRSTTLTDLNLARNPLKADASADVGKMLQASVSLKTLDLTECAIDNKGLASILLPLSTSNVSLSSLCLDNNAWSSDSMKSFTQLFSGNTSLTLLSIREMSTSLQREVQDAWQKSPYCFHLMINESNEVLVTGTRNKRLSGLNLTQFPAQLYTHMTFLTHLDLSRNPIRILPANISRITNLQYLNLNGCAIEQLPVELSELKRLRTLSVDGCPIISPPPEVMKKDLKSILNFLNELKCGSVPSYRCKLMFVGQENVGKTSLQRVIQHDQLMHMMKSGGLQNTTQSAASKIVGAQTTAKVTKGLGNLTKNLKKAADSVTNAAANAAISVGLQDAGGTSDTNKAAIWNAETGEFGAPLSTDGIDINDWTLSCKFGKSGKHKITFSVWDAAGQEVYETTHQFFLSERSIYVVVFDLRFPETKSKVEFWLQSVMARAPSAPIMVVGTHADDPICTPEHVDTCIRGLSEKYQIRYPNIKGFVGVACKGNLGGILSFKAKLKEIAASLPWMGEPVPRTYIELENLVKKERKKTDLVSFTGFCELASLVAIREPERVRAAAKALHEFGTVVYFDEKKSGLRDIVILQPQFLTALMATLITTKPTGVKLGKLMHKDLPFIWRAPQFPPELHGAFLSLLENFEVSFTPREEDPAKAYSLLPCLLPEARDEAEVAKFWQPQPLPDEMEVERRYELAFVPAGLFSRLMVRMLQYSGGLVLASWRNGAIMRKVSSRSRDLIFMEIDPVGRTVTAIVRGRAPQQSLRVVVETVGIMLTAWYHISAIRWMRCPFCKMTAAPASAEPAASAAPASAEGAKYGRINLVDCEKAAAEGDVHNAVVKCHECGKDVPLPLVAPDIAMTDFDGCIIPPDDLQIGEELGRGGFGLIHKGIWKGQPVAIKTINMNQDDEADGDDDSDKSEPDEFDLAELATQKQETYLEFRREVWLMSSLKHPNLVQLLGYCTSPFRMVMQLIPHGDLYAFLHSKASLSSKLMLRFAADIAQGMTYLSEQTPPVVHRDLKSPNVLLMALDPSQPVCAVVSDFGASVPMLISSLREKTDDRVVQLPTWLAPEVLSEGSYTESSDVYAMGIIMWELVTRQHPFGEERFKFNYLIEEAVLMGERPEVPRACDPGFADLMRACWGPAPEERPSFRAVSEGLKEIAQRLEPTLHIEVLTPEQSWNRSTLSVMRFDVLRKSGEARKQIRST